MKKEAKQLRALSKIIFFTGAFLLAVVYLSEKIRFGSLIIEINIYEKLFASFMIYSAILFYLLSKENQPFKKSFKYLKSSLHYIYLIIILFIISSVFGFMFAEKLSFLNETLREIIAKTMYLDTYELTAFILMNNAVASLIGIIGGIILGILPIFSSIGNGTIIGYVLEKVGIAYSWRLLPHGIFELPAIFISFGLGAKLGFGFFVNYIKYYWKKAKILVLLPILLALFSLIASIFSKELLFQKIPFPFASILLIPLLFILNLLFYFTILMLITYICNKKLRLIQNKLFKQRLHNSLMVFIFIIVPLLAIAAIIEGLLIALLP